MKFTRNQREIAAINRDFRIIGLTGGIASGKTAATDALRRAGYTVVDADEISRELTANGTPCEQRLIELFPAAKSADGTLDRKALRRLICVDDSARKTLDGYTHPLIYERIKAILSGTTPPVVLSAPLLFETALSSLCDAVVCIVCPKQLRIRRLAERDAMSIDEATRMTNMQTPDAVRATLSDFCIPSDVDKTEFEAEVVELFDALFKRRKG